MCHLFVYFVTFLTSFRTKTTHGLDVATRSELQLYPVTKMWISFTITMQHFTVIPMSTENIAFGTLNEKTLEIIETLDYKVN